MKRICLMAAAAVLGLGSGPAWAEGPGSDYFVREDRVVIAPMIPMDDPNQTGDPNQTTESSPTCTPTPTPTPEPGRTSPPDPDDELAETGSIGWGAMGLGFGVVIAGVGVLVLIRRK